MIKKTIVLALAIGSGLLFYTNCATSEDSAPAAPAPTCLELLGQNTEWSGETEITITGYSGNAMEPRISADQVTLFFNNKTSTDTEMDIHYALKTAPNTYQYKGTLTGTVDPAFLDGVPAVDSSARFYFVSLRTYPSNLRTLFSGQIAIVAGPALEVQSVASADAAVALNQPGKLDMDIDVSWDGALAVASNADFASGLGYPDTSSLAFYNVDTTTRLLTPMANSAALLANVNLPQCRVYAGALSNDKLELYYTVFPSGTTISATDFKLVVAKRTSTAEPFAGGQVITAATGELIEGPSLSYDDGGKTLYYHKKDSVSGDFKIYKMTRP